jgi:hypothetical protein
MPDKWYTHDGMIEGDNVCKALGGDYDYGEQSCSFNMANPDAPPQTLDTPSVAAFFILQAVVSCISTLINVMYNQITVFPHWWTSFIILGISMVFSYAMYWFKTADVGEAVGRTLLSTGVIFIISLFMWWIINWDVTVGLTIVEIAEDPVNATMQGVPISAVISYVLAPPSETVKEHAQASGKRSSNKDAAAILLK